jgi:hypothetical protein
LLLKAEEQRCGGYLTADSGELEYPASGSGDVYPHNITCAWLITVNDTKVVGYRFDRFEVEAGHECQYDFLQVSLSAFAGVCYSESKRDYMHLYLCFYVILVLRSKMAHMPMPISSGLTATATSLKCTTR